MQRKTDLLWPDTLTAAEFAERYGSLDIDVRAWVQATLDACDQRGLLKQDGGPSSPLGLGGDSRTDRVVQPPLVRS